MNEITRKRLALDFNRIAELYKQVFSTDAGKIVLDDLRARAFMTMTTAGPTDRDTFINEGKRTVALHIDTMLEHEPEKGEQDAKSDG